MSKKLKQRVFEVIRENEEWLPQFPCPDSIRYDDVRTLADPIKKYETTEVKVFPWDSFELAQNIEAKGEIMVENHASEWRPGGGYLKGSTTQEEVLMYRSNYILSLKKVRYPLGPYTAVYTPSVTILRDTNYEKLRRQERKKVACIAMPAIRKPKLVHGKYTQEQRALMKEKIKGIFKISALHGHTILVLGALGCGAFDNPPEEVATIFREVIREYWGCFKGVFFAVLDSRRWDNYPIFSRILANVQSNT